MVQILRPQLYIVEQACLLIVTGFKVMGDVRMRPSVGNCVCVCEVVARTAGMPS